MHHVKIFSKSDTFFTVHKSIYILLYIHTNENIGTMHKYSSPQVTNMWTSVTMADCLLKILVKL